MSDSLNNYPFSVHEVSFSYLPRTKCLHTKQALMKIQGYGSGADPRLYQRCVQCGIVSVYRANNVFTKYI